MGLLGNRRRMYNSQNCIISTITINQNLTDPAQMITGDVNGKAIQAIRANSHIYLGKYLGEENGVGNMAICQLDDNDSNFYYDGSPADLTGGEGDVFMGLPRFYTKAVEREPDIWDISFAYGKKPDDDWKEWGGNDLIGVYTAHIKDDMMYSFDKAVITTNIIIKNFLQYGENRGIGYSAVKIKHANIIAFLFFAMYGTTDVKEIIGEGTFGTGNDVTGETTAIGMNDTHKSDHSTKLLGLEDWYTKHYESFSDIKIINNKTWEIEEDNEIRTYEKDFSGGSVDKIYINRFLDVIPKNVGNNNNFRYCSFMYGYAQNVRAYDIYPLKSGSPNVQDMKNTGIVSINSYNGSNYAAPHSSSRLCFQGNLIKTSVQKFKQLSIIN